MLYQDSSLNIDLFDLNICTYQGFCGIIYCQEDGFCQDAIQKEFLECLLFFFLPHWVGHWGL